MEGRPSSDEINRETAEEQVREGGRFARESGEETSAVESPGAGPGGSNPADTSESELTGSAEPGTVATPEGTEEVDEDFEEDLDEGDVTES
jgi:hypothetical protein